jgi:hypothetical protein
MQGWCGQAQAAVSEGEGDLAGQGSLLPCLPQRGKHTVDRLALCALHCLDHVLPLDSQRQVRYLPLKAAMEKEPAIPVRQRQDLQLVFQVAGMVSTAVCVSGQEGCGADRGPCVQEAVKGVVHSEVRRRRQRHP